MMHGDEFRYRSKDDLNLYARVWRPEGDVRGVVALVHGLGEYGGRYVDIGHSFVDRGYAFVAGDLRGHGMSEGRRAFAARLDDFMDDLDQYCDEVRTRFPGKPLFLYGFSMGSTLGVAYLVRRHPRLAGVILCSGGFVMPPASAAAMSKVKALRHLVPTMAVSNGMGAMRDKVCHDVTVLDAYDADPLVYKKITVGLAAVIGEANAEALVRAGEIQVPLLVMHGEDDVIALPEGSQRLAAGASGDVTLKLWPGLYHFIHHEPDGAKERVLAFAADWLDAHVTG
ncbi:alpha/beta hydrolase [Candidatus Cryosericum terrychapinii]|jgi:alpha-beta hydrolase superfamily lysophospholipase|uniref:Lysophospholipase n=1 Tax=Candidatus Cryosericum terrychapinii TaxID=2290919 RepID=A0A398CW66_9BACT|nr:alpha/beta hydrolase [Candidatus Cryosericum terrychapinii]RIE05559.1 lysophospholipase [Candidatus Cryosericum terrychapinii]